jgi:short-subunit dehydrogenase
MASSSPQPGTALITGASTGIGATYADRLARRGYNLVLVARDQQRLDEVAVRLRDSYGVTVDTVQADLTRPADLARVEQRLAQDAAITLLLNNAGATVEGSFVGSDIDKVENMITLNVIAPTRLAKAAAARMAAAGAGTIINLGSVTALMAETFSGTYSGTKAYMLNLSIAMQVELSKSGVRVQAVLPGATRTEIWERAGIDLNAFPASMVMSADDMVDAALAGLDLGETITIPPLPEMADWDAYTAARLALQPNLSRSEPAARYRKA